MPVPHQVTSSAAPCHDPYRGVDRGEVVRWYASARDKALAETRVHSGELPSGLSDSDHNVGGDSDETLTPLTALYILAQAFVAMFAVCVPHMM